MNIGAISSSTQTIVASIQQETQETATQTKAEAAKGDQQAVRKLAKISLQKAQSQVAPAAEATTSANTSASTGSVVNIKV